MWQNPDMSTPPNQPFPDPRADGDGATDRPVTRFENPFENPFANPAPGQTPGQTTPPTSFGGTQPPGFGPATFPESRPMEFPAAHDANARLKAVQRLRRYRPHPIKYIAALIPIVFVVLFFPAMLEGLGAYAGTDKLREFLGGTFILLGFGLPGIYWFVRNRRDKAVVNDWLARRGTGETLNEVLKTKDYEQLMNDPVAPPFLPYRRWWLVPILMLVCWIVGGNLLPY